MNNSLSLLLGASLVVAATVSAPAQLINIATDGTPIFGYNAGGTAVTTLGTNYTQYDNDTNPPTPTSSTLNDGVTTGESTPNTNYGNQGSDGYAGYTSLAIPTGDAIVSLNLYMHAFGDGGWFGPNADYSSNNPLEDSDLTAPILQVTVDNGLTWSTVLSTNNYVDQYDGTTGTAYRNSDLPEVTYTLAAPLTGVDGIRLIGTNGGYASNTGYPGFISVNELQVEAEAVPEPATWAFLLAGASLLGIFAWRRFGLTRA
jgi:hypothetical protein